MPKSNGRKIAKRPPGRPTIYGETVAERICARLAEGESLRRICRHRGMPTFRTVHNWLRRHQGFFQQYARARDIGLDAYAEETLEIADNTTPKTAVADRLKFDTHRWYLSKLAPKRYGDRVFEGGGVNVIINTDLRPQMRQVPGRYTIELEPEDNGGDRRNGK